MSQFKKQLDKPHKQNENEPFTNKIRCRMEMIAGLGTYVTSQASKQTNKATKQWTGKKLALSERKMDLFYFFNI